MAQIPGLPTNDPVAKPDAKPSLFGIGGDTVANLGAESEQMAQGALAVEGHLMLANRQLKAKEAQISFDRTLEQVHVDLSKATTPEQAQTIYDHAQGQLNDSLAPYEHDPVLARELGLYRQQQDVELQHVVNAKKADIITKSDQAANVVLGDKSLQQAIVTKMGGGDAAPIREQFNLQLQSSVAHGTLLPEQAQAHMAKWDMDYQKGVIIASINSPSIATRQDTIAQLSKGGGTFDHSALNAEEMGQLYTHAVDTDHNLTQKEEAGSLNGALNIKHEWFSSPEFRNPDGTPNYEAREKALEDGDQLVAHGITTPDGKPNFVMADKLLEDDAKQWQMHQKVQHDKDEAVLEKYSPQLYDPTHPLTIQQIENLPQTDGASSRAVNQLKTALFQEQRNARAEQRENRSLGLAERAEKRRQLEDRSVATSLGLTDRIANGDVLDYNKDILEPVSQGKMTEAERAKVWRMYKDSEQYSQIGEGIGIIASTYKAMPNTPENNRKAADARDSFLKTVKEKNLHGADILQEAQSVAEQTGKVAAGRWIDRMFAGFGQQLGYKANPTTSDSTTENGGLSSPPPGATMRVPNKSGKLYWFNDKHENLGPVN